MHPIAMHLILFRVPGYQLLSDEDEPPLQHEDPAYGGSALDDMQPQIWQPILQQQPAPTPFDFAAFMHRSGGNKTTLLATIREADAHLPPGPIVVYSERAGGAVRLNILHIAHILQILLHYHFCHRREVLKQQASDFWRSLCETSAYAISETVSIAFGNRIVQAVGNVSVLYILHINHILHIIDIYLLHIHFILREISKQL
jgi:hypothetical protein